MDQQQPRNGPPTLFTQPQPTRQNIIRIKHPVTGEIMSVAWNQPTPPDPDTINALVKAYDAHKADTVKPPAEQPGAFGTAVSNLFGPTIAAVNPVNVVKGLYGMAAHPLDTADALINKPSQKINDALDAFSHGRLLEAGSDVISGIPLLGSAVNKTADDIAAKAKANAPFSDIITGVLGDATGFATATAGGPAIARGYARAGGAVADATGLSKLPAKIVEYGLRPGKLQEDYPNTNFGQTVIDNRVTTGPQTVEAIKGVESNLQQAVKGSTSTRNAGQVGDFARDYATQHSKIETPDASTFAQRAERDSMYNNFMKANEVRTHQSAPPNIFIQPPSATGSGATAGLRLGPASPSNAGLLPGLGETSAGANTRFFGGRAGIADVGERYLHDTADAAKLRQPGTLLPDEYGQTTNPGPIIAAEATVPQVGGWAEMYPQFKDQGVIDMVPNTRPMRGGSVGAVPGSTFNLGAGAADEGLGATLEHPTGGRVVDQPPPTAAPHSFPAFSTNTVSESPFAAAIRQGMSPGYKQGSFSPLYGTQELDASGLLDLKRKGGDSAFRAKTQPSPTNVAEQFYRGESLGARQGLEQVLQQDHNLSAIDMLKQEQDLMGVEEAFKQAKNSRVGQGAQAGAVAGGIASGNPVQGLGMAAIMEALKNPRLWANAGIAADAIPRIPANPTAAQMALILAALHNYK